MSNAANWLNRICRTTNNISCVLLVTMMLVTTVDVIGRYIFNRPLLGANEIAEFMQASMVFLAVAYTAVRKGHVAVDIVFNRLRPKVQQYLSSVTSLLGTVLFALITHQSAVQSMVFKEATRTTPTLDVPIWPFVLFVTLGYGLLCLVLLVDFIHSISQGAQNKRERWLRVLAAVVVAFAFSVVLVWSQQLPRISMISTGIGGMILLFILLFARMPVAFTLMTVGLLGASYVRGFEPVVAQVGRLPYVVPANYDWTVIALFVFMGFLAFAAGLGHDLYHVVYKWLGNLPGGLAIASIGGCAGFAAVCGDSLATAITMGTVSLPEMKAHKYDDALATGAVASGGTLGVLIPPSIAFIIYAMLTEESIGKLFIAGILPGILLTSLFVLSIYVRCKLNPRLGPPGPKTSFKEKITSLGGGAGAIVLFGLVMGGIYFGLFTATEAGAIGSFGALVIGLSQRRFNWQNFSRAVVDSVNLAAMCFTILIGASVFSLFLSLTKLPMDIASIVIELPIPHLGILILIYFIYIILGCVMPGIPLIILTVPILFPVIVALGYDPVWFGVILVLTNEMAVITPPVGINVYGIAGVAKDVPMSTIFRGIFPFFIVLVLTMAIITAFPQIATFLPSIMIQR